MYIKAAVPSLKSNEFSISSSLLKVGEKTFPTANISSLDETYADHRLPALVCVVCYFLATYFLIYFIAVSADFVQIAKDEYSGFGNASLISFVIGFFLHMICKDKRCSLIVTSAGGDQIKIQFPNPEQLAHTKDGIEKAIAQRG